MILIQHFYHRLKSIITNKLKYLNPHQREHRTTLTDTSNIFYTANSCSKSLSLTLYIPAKTS
jgi:hypothetical protein